MSIILWNDLLGISDVPLDVFLTGFAEHRSSVAFSADKTKIVTVK